MSSFNEKCNADQNLVIRFMAIISFIAGLFIFPFLDLDSERLTHVYTLVMLVIGAYVGRRITQDVSSKKYTNNVPTIGD